MDGWMRKGRQTDSQMTTNAESLHAVCFPILPLVRLFSVDIPLKRSDDARGNWRVTCASGSLFQSFTVTFRMLQDATSHPLIVIRKKHGVLFALGNCYTNNIHARTCFSYQWIGYTAYFGSIVTFSNIYRNLRTQQIKRAPTFVAYVGFYIYIDWYTRNRMHNPIIKIIFSVGGQLEVT
jgi:hypothetical protein